MRLALSAVVRAVLLSESGSTSQTEDDQGEELSAKKAFSRLTEHIRTYRYDPELRRAVIQILRGGDDSAREKFEKSTWESAQKVIGLARLVTHLQQQESGETGGRKLPAPERWLPALIAQTIPQGAIGPLSRKYPWAAQMIYQSDLGRINEVVPRTGLTLHDYFLQDNIDFIREMESAHGVRRPLRVLGFGMQGIVFQLPDGNVMKISNDGSEQSVMRTYTDRMQRQHSGSRRSAGDPRILSVHPLLFRWHSTNPEYGGFAVIMERLIPTDSSPRVSKLMGGLLMEIIRVLSLASVSHIDPEGQAEALNAIMDASDIDDLDRRFVPLPSHFTQSNPHPAVRRDKVGDAKILDKISQDFLRGAQGAAERNPQIRELASQIERAVGEEYHVRLRSDWLHRMIQFVADEARSGRSDIKPDNFGIDAKGDIIPFDL
jgi:hypothetical protein